MAITTQNILAHEWIGLNVTVKQSPDPTITGTAGIVKDETRNTFSIVHERKTLKVAKANTVFIASLPNGENVTVDGNKLRYRPEDRVKKGLTRW